MRSWTGRSSSSAGSLVTQAVDGAQLRGLPRRENRRNRANRQRRNRDRGVVPGAHVNGEPVDVIAVGIEPEAKPGQSSAERDSRRDSEEGAGSADDDPLTH